MPVYARIPVFAVKNLEKALDFSIPIVDFRFGVCYHKSVISK